MPSWTSADGCLAGCGDEVVDRDLQVGERLLEAAAGDPEVAQWCAQLEAGRWAAIAEVLELVYGRQPDERTVDIVWSLVGIETCTKLCFDRGWTTGQWQEWAVEAIRLFAGRP